MVTIKQVGNIAIEFLIIKKKEAEQRVGISDHDAELNVAREVWDIYYNSNLIYEV